MFIMSNLETVDTVHTHTHTHTHTSSIIKEIVCIIKYIFSNPKIRRPNIIENDYVGADDTVHPMPDNT